MARSLTALLVALSVLLPGVGSSAAAQMAGMGTHACCLRMQAQRCAGTTITCCPAPERGRESTAPSSSSSSTAAGTAQPNGGHPSSMDVPLQPPLAKALALDAHAHVRANAPPGPLYLRHLTLLV